MSATSFSQPRRPTVLISGASIAGPALAYWLNRYGWQTTIIERSESLRSEGQNIDVRGAGREVVRRMGIEDEIRAASTGEQGMRFVDALDNVIAEFPAGKSDTDGATAELEILHGELARILVEHTDGETEYIFGDHITTLADTAATDKGAARVTVEFAAGEPRDFDLVVIAEGMGSTTRSIVFGNACSIRPLGMYTAWFTIPRGDSDTAWAKWYNTTNGRAIVLRPDNLGTTQAALSFLSDSKGYEALSKSEQREVLRRKFSDAGWQAPRVLRHLDDADFHFEALGQVHASGWSRGRTALLGDAACGSSPISGMGTSLALVGAYVLAGQLATEDTHMDAFRTYERIMRPYADKAQKLPPGAPRLANPKSNLGLGLFRLTLRAADSPVAAVISALGGKFFSPPADKINLPCYVEVKPQKPPTQNDQ